MILTDTSGLIALVDRDDLEHKRVKAYAGESLLIPTTALCEVDYMLTKYLGEHIAKTFFETVVTNHQLLSFDTNDLVRVNQIRRQYEDLPLGFVDASIVALAERYRIRRVLTLDRRHLSAVKPLHLGYLELLP